MGGRSKSNQMYRLGYRFHQHRPIMLYFPCHKDGSTEPTTILKFYVVTDSANISILVGRDPDIKCVFERIGEFTTVLNVMSCLVYVC